MLRSMTLERHELIAWWSSRPFRVWDHFLFDRGPLCGLPLVAFKMWVNTWHLFINTLFVGWKHQNITLNPFQPLLFANEHTIFTLPTMDPPIHIFSLRIRSRYLNLDIYRYWYYFNTRALFALTLSLSLLLIYSIAAFILLVLSRRMTSTFSRGLSQWFNIFLTSLIVWTLHFLPESVTLGRHVKSKYL